MSDRETRKANVVEALNKARSMELHAIHQYMNQHYNLDDMDYGELAANMKLIAIDEMRHCEMFAERIKELGGEPTSEVAGKVVKGQEVKAIYSSDSDSEDDTIFVYNELRKVCVDNGDILTAKLFETIIGEEQIHLNYFDNISDHIETLGDTFLSKIAGTPSSTGGTTKGFAIAPATNAARDLAQFSARFGTPLTYKLSKLAHCMQRPGECLPAFAFTLRVWGMAVFSASDACAMTASKRGRTGTDGMRAGSPGLYFHAVCAHVLMKGGVPS